MMIPARVAIALQEPWHVGPIKREVDRAWLAGFVDGDGCIGIRQQANGEWNPTYIPYLTVGSSDTALLERCVAITGLGSVNQKSSAGDTDARGIKQRRDGFTWRLDGQIASRVIRDIYPYLVQKKPQALVCNAMNLSQGEPRPTKTRPVAADIVAYRSDLYVKIKALNQRQLVDLGNLPAVEPNIEPGFYLRSEIIWSKSAPMPESVRDRPTCAHEKVWLLTKASTYFYDADAVKEPSVSDHQSGNGFKRDARLSYRDDDGARGNDKQWTDVGGTRNLRNVWHLNPKPFPGAHFATMPATLAERCIKAGTSERGQCPHCGAPWCRDVERQTENMSSAAKAGTQIVGKGHPSSQVRQGHDIRNGPISRVQTIGWSPSCSCPEHDPVPQTVLDPFSGAGTTLVVASRLQRNAIGIELNPQYVELARRRIYSDGPLFAGIEPSQPPPVSCGMTGTSQSDWIADSHPLPSETPETVEYDGRGG